MFLCKKKIIFTDPTEWNSNHIKTWLEWIASKFDITPVPIPSRFPTDGRELVTLTRADFWVCAGSKEGGNTLAKHMAHLLYGITGKWESPMLSDIDPGMLIYNNMLI